MKTTKDLAQRIDPGYHRIRHPLRRLRLLLSAGLAAAAGLWTAASFALSGEGIYVRGGMARAHAPVGDECGRCHVDAFRAVIDAACLSCHAVGAHVPAGESPPDPRCGTCHAEHGGRARLAEVADGHCNACHQRHRAITSIEDHAQFERAPRDQHLRFNHRAHLARDLLGGPLACGDCHRPQPDARDFERIRFDAHCARCHAERLHPDLKDAVPHGIAPGRLREWAAAAFVRAFLDDPGLAAAPSRPNTAPGRSPGAPPDWTATLRGRTDAALDALLTPGRGCLLCHEGDAERIVPPEIPSNWLPKARFDHKTHRAEPCTSCHRAEGTAEAEAVDLPGVQSCHKCHRDGGAPAACATCHPYHPPHPAAWR
jgi:predicted CXXCH cytochrome family protein